MDLNIEGFRSSSIHVGIKPGTASSRSDMALIVAEEPAVAYAMFTTNVVKAAPVIVSSRRLKKGRCQAVLVNSGNANACTGRAGIADVEYLTRIVAEELSLDEDLVVMASTGVIGVPLPRDRMAAAVPKLVSALKGGTLEEVARAIMTTDTVPKIAMEAAEIGGSSVHLLAVAKGSGMIMPQLATMLCFVLTDARITGEALSEAFHSAVDASLHRVTVDGDTSTNDTAMVLSSGKAGNALIIEKSEEFNRFSLALERCLVRIAKMLARDGEGATKFVEIVVKGAPGKAEARTVAKTIANSPLVKTAIFGEDPNWGRIICAAGRAGVLFDPANFDLFFDDVPVVQKGIAKSREVEERAKQVMAKNEFRIILDLKSGKGEDSVYTCDLSKEYVSINAEYRT